MYVLSKQHYFIPKIDFMWTLVCIIICFKREFVWYIELEDAWEGFKHQNGCINISMIHIYNCIDLKSLYHQNYGYKLSHDDATRAWLDIENVKQCKMVYST